MAIESHILGESEMRAWDDFVAAESRAGGLGNVHQTSRWGRFQEAGKQAGWKWWIVGVFDEGRLVGGSLVLKRLMSMGKCWLYVPKGPIFDYKDRAVREVMMAWLVVVREIAKQEKAIYLRVEPGMVEHGPEDFGLRLHYNWDEIGFVKAHAHYQPENTVVVDLGPSEEQILAKMKAKGRYNIKLAEKKGVEVVVAGEAGCSLEQGVTVFHKILNETTDRDGFSGHPEKYYLEMLRGLGPEAKLYLAKFEGEYIAGILVTFFGDLAIYYFGASSNRHRNVMSPYLLQWKAMQEAKKRGIRWYDFLGTAPLRDDGNGDFTYDAKHAWAGVTEFKLKFGGQKVDFYPGEEMVFGKVMYWVVKARKRA